MLEAEGDPSPLREKSDPRAAPLGGGKGPDQETEGDLGPVPRIVDVGQGREVEGGAQFFAVVPLTGGTDGRGNLVTLQF